MPEDSIFLAILLPKLAPCWQVPVLTYSNYLASNICPAPAFTYITGLPWQRFSHLIMPARQNWPGTAPSKVAPALPTCRVVSAGNGTSPKQLLHCHIWQTAMPRNSPPQSSSCWGGGGEQAGMPTTFVAGFYSRPQWGLDSPTSTPIAATAWPFSQPSHRPVIIGGCMQPKQGTPQTWF